MKIKKFIFYTVLPCLFMAKCLFNGNRTALPQGTKADVPVPNPLVPDPNVPAQPVPNPLVPDPNVPAQQVPNPPVPDPNVPAQQVPNPPAPDPQVPAQQVHNPPAPDPQVPAQKVSDGLNDIIGIHNQKINKEALIKLFSSHGEKKLLTPLHRVDNHVYQIGHNYILKVCNAERFNQREQQFQQLMQKANNQAPLEPLGDFRKIHTDLRDAKQKEPNLPIVGIYAVFEIEGVVPKDRLSDVGDLKLDQFDHISLLHDNKKDTAPLPLIGVVMEPVNTYSKNKRIAPGNFKTIPDYAITVLYLQSSGIFLDDEKLENMGYILTDQKPVYEINGKYYRVAQPAKENGKFIKTVWFDFDMWKIKNPPSGVQLQAEVDKLIAQRVILPAERCMNQGQGG